MKNTEVEYESWTTEVGYIATIIFRRLSSPHKLPEPLETGYWCGYVTIPEKHPLSEKRDVPDHVGRCITFADMETDGWTFGFHYGDIFDDPSIFNREHAKAECEALAAELKVRG